jgi:hypothetical protein
MNRLKFQHECPSCTFLGHFNDHDLYCCRGSALPTVLARYGNEPYEYISGIPSIDSVPELTEAIQRAVKQGLIPKYKTKESDESVIGDFIG